MTICVSMTEVGKQPQKNKILIVEDDIYTLELYERQLKRAGFDVYRAIDGEEGFKVAKDIKPDLVLLDIMLPKVDGFEMLKNMRNDKETKDLPVLILTNLGRESIVKEGFNLGAQGYLIKASYTPNQVVDTVSKFLAKSKSTV